MARRVGNIARPADVYAEGYTPVELRYALLATHYRAPLEWGDETLDHARAAVERLSTAVAALDAYEEDEADDPDLPAALDSARAAFKLAMDDDLNVSGALAAVMELVRESNRRIDARSLSTGDARRAAAALRDLDSVLGRDLGRRTHCLRARPRSSSSARRHARPRNGRSQMNCATRSPQWAWP